MDITISEKRLLDFAVSYLESMYSNLEKRKRKNSEENDYDEFFLKGNEIIVSFNTLTNRVIVDRQVADELDQMFGFNFPYIKHVILRWLGERYEITNPNTLYIGKHHHFR
jgi:hypothetical protein